MNEVLMNQVRRKLNITWDDDETTKRLFEIIGSAIPYLLHRLGIADPYFDFSRPGMENTLFLAYCLYEWNHAANEFADNYAEMIATVRARHEVEYHQRNEASKDATE